MSVEELKQLATREGEGEKDFTDWWLSPAEGNTAGNKVIQIAKEGGGMFQERMVARIAFKAGMECVRQKNSLASRNPKV